MTPIALWLVQHLLISTAFAGVAWVICRSFRPHPAVRHLLWLVVLCRLVIPTASILPAPAGLPDEMDFVRELTPRPNPQSAPLAATSVEPPREVLIDDFGSAAPGPIKAEAAQQQHG